MSTPKPVSGHSPAYGSDLELGIGLELGKGLTFFHARQPCLGLETLVIIRVCTLLDPWLYPWLWIRQRTQNADIALDYVITMSTLKSQLVPLRASRQVTRVSEMPTMAVSVRDDSQLLSISFC